MASSFLTEIFSNNHNLINMNAYLIKKHVNAFVIHLYDKLLCSNE